MANLPLPTEQRFMNDGNLRLAIVTQWRQLISWLRSRQAAGEFAKTTVQSLTTATKTTLTTWGTTELDPPFGEFNRTTGVFTFTEGGTYLVLATAWFAASSTGTRIVYIDDSGGVPIREVRALASGTGGSSMQVSHAARWERQSQFSIAAWQSSGAGLDCAADLSVVRLSI